MRARERFDRWRLGNAYLKAGHVAKISWPDVKPGVSGHSDWRVRLARVGLLSEPNSSISMESL
jgi:hypothetical protein